MDLLKEIFKGDKVVWMIFLLLCVTSIIEVFSASSTLTYNSSDHWGPITQHCMLLLFGVVIVVLVHNMSYKWFKGIGLLGLYLSGVLLIVVMVTGLLGGGRINGAARWMSIGGVQFQPSEIAKMCVIIVTANLLTKGQTEDGVSDTYFKTILKYAGIIIALILPENYSTAILLGATVYLMMFIGRVKAKKLLIIGGTILTAATLFLSFLFITPNETLVKVPLGHRFTTAKARIAGFANGEKVPAAKFDTDKNAQKAHARIAIARSNLVGHGPGNSVERDFLSQAFSDFIFAIIIEELGLLPAAFVVFLYIWLLIRAYRIASKCDKIFPALLVIGIGLILVIQATFNMAVAVGLAPVTGQPLPLISKGGTSTFINCAYIGMILSVSRYTAKLEKEKLEGDKTLSRLSGEMAEKLEAKKQYLESETQKATEPDIDLLND